MFEVDAETWRDANAENNRRDFPLMASYLKALERFNPRAIWAEENGRRIGRERD